MFFRLQPQKFMTKALLVTALRLTFGNTMLKSNSLIDKLFDSFDYKRTDQMDWRSFLYLFTILMQPQSPFNIHLRCDHLLPIVIGVLCDYLLLLIDGATLFIHHWVAWTWIAPKVPQ